MVLNVQIINILLRDLHIRLQLQNINQELPFISQLILPPLNIISILDLIMKLVEHIKEYGVVVRRLHDIMDLVVQLVDETSRWMVNDILERFKADASFANVSIEQSDPDDYIRELTKLGDFLRSCQRDERSQPGPWQDRLEGRRNFSLDRARDRLGKFDLREIAEDMLLVLVKKIIEDPFVEHGDAFEVVSRPWLVAHDFVDESVGLMAEVRDVLLSLILLLDVGGVIADLQLDSVEAGGVLILQSLDDGLGQLFGLVL